MRCVWCCLYLLVFGGVWLLANAAAVGDVDQQALERLCAAGADPGSDPQLLAAAWRQVAEADIHSLPEVLAAFDTASPLGVNWLSSAVDAIVAQAQESPDQRQLTAFILDPSHGGHGRETALELLQALDPTAATTVIDQLVDDPIPRLRRPAVDKLIALAKDAGGDNQLAAYLRAFTAARDEDHVATCAQALRELGHPIDHIKKFGFLMRWQIIGPFDYQDGAGFDVAYAPENLTLENYDAADGIFSAAPIEGKAGPVKWKSFVNTARNGTVDLNKAIAELRDAVAYGATVFAADSAQEVEFRLRQQNACKVWLNGELIFTQPIGHTGNFFDQYTVPVKLRAGPNLILIKSCQTPGPAEHPFLKNWQVGLRVCDPTGAAVLAANRQPTPTLDPLPGKAAADEPAEDENSAGDEPDQDHSQTDAEVNES